jgi:hypothetical protein
VERAGKSYPGTDETYQEENNPDHRGSSLPTES